MTFKHLAIPKIIQESGFDAVLGRFLNYFRYTFQGRAEREEIYPPIALIYRLHNTPVHQPKVDLCRIIIPQPMNV